MAEVVYLHGFLGAPEDWDAVRREIPGRALALPQTGWDEAVRVVGEELGEAAVLVGYSMGARLALGVACAFPGRVAALVLESGTAGLEREEDRQARDALERSWAEAVSADYPAFVERWYRQPLFASLSDDQRAGLTAHRLCRDAGQVLAWLRGLSVTQQPSYWSGLARLPMPVLALAGSKDKRYAGLAKKMSEHCSRGRHQVVAGAGHNVHLEQSQAFVSAVRQFMDEASLC